MEKCKEIQMQILRDVEAFRVKQRQVLAGDNEVRKHQHRELQKILTSFWAGRAPGRLEGIR